jgi:transcriptional regulator with XRE-family HTH domain
MRKEIGARLRSARGKAKLTQKTVATALGDIDPGQISRWERGKSAPSVLQLLHMGARCNARPETFIEGLVEPTWEQLTNGLDGPAQAIVYDLAKVLQNRALPQLLPNEHRASSVIEGVDRSSPT